MLNSPTPTPAADKIGDRQAVENATRRAERRGTDDPKVSAASVRLALSDAKDLEDFQRLLDAEGIEIEFDRRGVGREIYGWRLRRTGAAEWQKASTVGKDWSWPKIAHRFAQVELSKPLQTPPAELKQTLPVEPPQHQVAPVAEPRTPSRKLVFDLHQIANLQIGPLSKVMLYLGGVVANLGFSALRLLFEFIRKILARLGFGMRPVQSITTTPDAPAQLEYEPFVIADARQVTQSDVDEAADQVFQVAEAVRLNDPSLLPPGEGRAELVEALKRADSTEPESSDEDKKYVLTAGAHEELAALARELQAGYLKAKSVSLLGGFFDDESELEAANTSAAAIAARTARAGRELAQKQLAFAVLRARLERSARRRVEYFQTDGVNDPSASQDAERLILTPLVELAGLETAKFSSGQELDERLAGLQDGHLKIAQRAKIYSDRWGGQATVKDAPKSELDAMFADDVAEASVPASEPPKPAAIQLDDAAKAFTFAAQTVELAREKNIDYVDARPRARERLESASSELSAAISEREEWQAANKFRSAIGAWPEGMRNRVEQAQARVDQARAGTVKADKSHDRFDRVFASTPTPPVPAGLLQKHADAVSNLRRAHQLLISGARLNLAVLDSNPMLRQRRELLAAKIRSAENRIDSYIADPRGQAKFLLELEDLERELAAEAAIERARQSQAHTPAFDDEHGVADAPSR